MKPFVYSAVALLSATLAAEAVPQYSGFALARCLNDTNTISVASEGTFEQEVSGDYNCQASAAARAGAGNIGVQSFILGGANVGFVQSRAAATVDAFYDVTFETPDDYTGGLIEASLNFDVSAALDVSIAQRPEDDYQTGRIASSTFSYIVRLFGEGGIGQSLDNVKIEVRDSNMNVGKNDQRVIEQSQTTTTVMIDPTETATVRFSLSTATTSLMAFSPVIGIADAFNSLTFAKSGPVFNLPDGFSATVIGGNVANNQFTPAISTVPLPAAGFALLFGLAGLTALRRR